MKPAAAGTLLISDQGALTAAPESGALKSMPSLDALRDDILARAMRPAQIVRAAAI